MSSPHQIQTFIQSLPEPLRDSLLEAVMQRAASTRTKTEPLYTPRPGGQELTFYSEADEVFFGGRAGTGKTYLLLGLALEKHIHSIIFRREYPQLKDIILKSRQLLAGTSARFNGQSNTWTGIPGGRMLELGACQHEWDTEKYQGRAHDFIGFDEITHFTKSQYLNLIAWARTTIQNQRVQVVCTGNPPSTQEEIGRAHV